MYRMNLPQVCAFGGAGKRLLKCTTGDNAESSQSVGLCLQAETYRRMRKATKGDWQKHTPATNTLWMHYLADLLLSQKQVPQTAREKRELRGFRWGPGAQRTSLFQASRVPLEPYLRALSVAHAPLTASLGAVIG